MNKLDLCGHYNELTNTLKKIADNILANPLAFSYMSLHEASQKMNVSEVSLIKFSRACGYEKFIDLRDAVRTQLLSETGFGKEKQDDQSPFQHIREEVSRNIHVTLSGVDDALLEKYADDMLNAREIYIFGHDVSKTCADYFSRKLKIMRFNAHSVLLGDEYEMHSVLAKLDPKDYVVVFSFQTYYGPTRSVVEMCRKKDVKTLGITDSSESPAFTGPENTIFCQTLAKNTDLYNFNTMSAPIAVIELLLLRIAEKMGSRIHEIMSEINGIEETINQ